MTLPAPELFAGIRQVLDHNRAGHPSYLLGQVSPAGFWYFYPVALAVKTPIPFLLLLLAGTALVFTRFGRSRRLWIPLAFSLGILIVGIFSRINIGIRHVLPVYMGFALLGGAALVRAVESSRGSRLIGAALTLWFVGSSVLAHPDYLAYFNAFAGDEP